MLFGFESGGLELRRSADGSHRLHGRFPYGKPAVLSDGGRTGRPRKEVIAPRAFAHRVNDPSQNILLLSGHDFSKPLASRATNTLDLTDSDSALTFDATITPQVADTAHGADVLKLIDSGLAVGISPGFRIPPARAVKNAERIEQEPMDPARGMFAALIRWILAALLYELSIVTQPAYPEAQIEARNWTPDSDSGLLLPSGLHRSLNRWRA